MPTDSESSSACICVHLWFSPVFFFVKARITHERAERRRPCDVETGVAVEAAELQHVGAEKAPARAEDRRANRKAAAPGLLLAHEEVGERVDLRDVAGERRERIMVQVAP